MTEPLFNVLQARRAGDMPKSYWRTVDDEHATIIDRIEASDHDGAVEAMRTHLAHRAARLRAARRPLTRRR